MNRKTTTAKKTPAAKITGKRIHPKKLPTEILGLPIENTDHTTDTKAAKKAEKARLKAEKQALKLFQGTIEADRVYRKRMTEFKNCIAFAWMIINGDKVTYANSYGQTEDGTMPRSSWRPEDYTHPLNEKTLAKKLETYQDVEDREEWPAFIKPAFHPTEKPAKKSRRTK